MNVIRHLFSARLSVMILAAAGMYEGRGWSAAETNPPASNAITNNAAKTLYDLARQYARGTGVTQNPEQAAHYMQQAAGLGYAFAQNDLGSYYARGFGVQQDYEAAARWYLQGAEAGDALAQYSMGRCCAEGRGVKPDMESAIRWYRRAADQQQPDAMMALGILYFEGQNGVKMDYQEACRWFLQAAELGQNGADNSAGLVYETGGHGLAQDLGKALECYRKAADKNDPRGQMNYGRMFREGLGTKADFVQAYKWFYLASLNGDNVARHYQLELEGNNPTGEPQLTAEQMADAVKQAQEYLNAIKPRKDQ